MTTVRTAIKAVLTGDATLAALATGGIHDTDSVGRRGLTRETLMVSGQAAILPAIFINWVTDAPFGDHQATLGARRLFFEAYFFQDTGYATIVSMRLRARGLLEYQPVQFTEPANERMRDILWRGDVLGQKDESLGDASMERTRYEVLITPVAVEA